MVVGWEGIGVDTFTFALSLRLPFGATLDRNWRFQTTTLWALPLQCNQMSVLSAVHRVPFWEQLVSAVTDTHHPLSTPMPL